MNWICCQIGAREHYAVARALNKHEELECLITDAWLRPSNPLTKVKRSLQERFHDQLAHAHVSAGNLSIVGFEMRARLTGLQWMVADYRAQQVVSEYGHVDTGKNCGNREATYGVCLLAMQRGIFFF